MLKRIVISTSAPIADINKLYDDYLNQKVIKEFENTLHCLLLDGYPVFFTPVRPKSGMICSDDDKFILITKSRVWFSEHIVKLAEMSSYQDDVMELAAHTVFRKGGNASDFLIKASIHIESGEEVKIYGFPIELFKESIEFLK